MVVIFRVAKFNRLDPGQSVDSPQGDCQSIKVEARLRSERKLAKKSGDEYKLKVGFEEV